MVCLKSQRGQGTTEYLLVLFLSVAIILGAIFQLNTAFRSWADNYFGEYLSCLLETGELPSLSGGSDGVCDQEFKSFSIADGRPALGDRIGEGGGSRDDDGESDESESPTPAATASADGGNSNSSGRSGFARGSRGSRFRASSPIADGDGKSNEKDQSGEVNFNTYNQGGRIVRIPIRDTDEIRRRRYREDQKDKERSKVKTDIASRENEREGAPQLIKKSTRKPAQEVAEDGFEWSFGNILRILIIIAILIALLLFLGGQALQVSKSLD